MMAPVRVARSMIARGEYVSWAYQSASASTSRPSASVLTISIVCPDIDVMMSPGRIASPSGMFSTRPMTPTALTFALRAASACKSPTTQAAPPMSPFISSMPAEDLMEMPPESKQTPLPTKAIGFVRFDRAPFHRMVTRRLFCAEPRPTPSSAFMPSLAIAFSSSASTSTPSFSSALARSANSTGKRTFGGSLTRLRANSTPSATAKRSCPAARAAATWLEPMTKSGASTLSSSDSFLRVLYLSKR